MKDFKYHLSVENCRGIKSAEIDLSEITVLTGVNASGKSTIARMFRDLVEMSAEYERLLAVQMWNSRLDLWRYALENIRQDRGYGIAELRRVDIPKGLAKGTISLQSAVDLLDRVLAEQDFGESDAARPAMELLRIKRILGLEKTVADLLPVFRAESLKILEKFERRRTCRSYDAYRDLVQDNPLFEGMVSLREGERAIFSSDMQKGSFDEVTFIKRAIYIESPFKSIPGTVTDTELEMGDSFKRIKSQTPKVTEGQMKEFLRVLSGNVDFRRENDGISALLGRRGQWMYNREDGASFSLEECATGIKALSILDILYSKGWLDPETLLVIDEPEAHLHPQWIVEYARILLLLSKRLRVRIVITSHSPDMVNAIHTMGLAMGMGDVINFYLAEADEKEKYKFNYRALKNKVGDIFKAYNVSFDRIDSYARSVGEAI